MKYYILHPWNKNSFPFSVLKRWLRRAILISGPFMSEVTRLQPSEGGPYPLLNAFWTKAASEDASVASRKGPYIFLNGSALYLSNWPQLYG